MSEQLQTATELELAHGDPSALAGDPTATIGPGQSPRRRFIRRFTHNPAAMTGAIVLTALVLIAVFAPLIAPYDPDAQELSNTLQRPGGDHFLGTDDLGRDMLSRLIFATRVSLLAALLAVGVGLALGGPLGLFAGYRGGWWDAVLSRIVDGVQSIPPLLLAIAIIGALGTSLTNAMLAVGIAYAPRIYRLLRGTTLAVREETYIEAIVSVGAPTRRILLRHVLPNVISPLIVQISLMMGFAILAEASLSFLGLGVQPPESSWGSMLGRAFREIYREPILVVFPGLAITLAVLAFNLFGDGLRDSLGREARKG